MIKLEPLWYDLSTSWKRGVFYLSYFNQLIIIIMPVEEWLLAENLYGTSFKNKHHSKELTPHTFAWCQNWNHLAICHPWMNMQEDQDQLIFGITKKIYPIKCKMKIYRREKISFDRFRKCSNWVIIKCLKIIQETHNLLSPGPLAYRLEWNLYRWRIWKLPSDSSNYEMPPLQQIKKKLPE